MQTKTKTLNFTATTFCKTCGDTGFVQVVDNSIHEFHYVEDCPDCDGVCCWMCGVGGEGEECSVCTAINEEHGYT